MSNSIIKFLISCVCVCCAGTAYALTLPSQAMGRPKIFDQVDKSYHWDQMVKNRDFSSLTNNAWTVYVVNDGCKAYDSPSKSAKEISANLHFMEDFFVASISGDFALLFYYDKRLDGLTIPVEATRQVSQFTAHGRRNGYVGWVSIDDLLLWTMCPQTKDGIFKKIAVVKDINALTHSNVNTNPELFVDAQCSKSASSPNYVNALDFYFAFKKDDVGNVLVYKNYQFEGDMRYQIVGWLKYGEYIDWNTRICWEPAFDGSINDFAYSFASNAAAYDYDLSQIRSKSALSNQRKSPNIPRSPVLTYNKQVAQLSVLATTSGSTDVDYDKVIREIETLKQSLSKINVVFVMDATNSMRSCFSAMSKAVQNISEYKYLNDDVRFGVVVYRNYADEKNNGLVDCCPLTNVKENGTTIAKFLDDTKCFSASSEAQEAMFYGLNYAVDNMTWSANNSNFIILISDVTTKDPDAKGFTSAEIVKKLAGKKINLVAFQARSYPESAYQNFSSQVGDIIWDLYGAMGYTNIEMKANGKTGITEYYQKEGSEKKWPLRPMASKYKASDDRTINSSELENMAEEMIKEFISETAKNINRLERQNAGGPDGGTEIDKSVCNELINLGIIRKCEDLTGILKVAGYSTRFSTLSKKKMFTPCVFLADKELATLISDMENVTRETVSKRRLMLQVLAKKLILSYTGQKFNSNTIDTDFDRIIREVEDECGYVFYRDIKTHIVNPNELEDTDIDRIIQRLRNSVSVLRDVQNDASNFKLQDEMKYYYILLDDMPFVKDKN